MPYCVKFLNTALFVRTRYPADSARSKGMATRAGHVCPEAVPDYVYVLRLDYAQGHDVVQHGRQSRTDLRGHHCREHVVLSAGYLAPVHGHHVESADG